MGRHPLKNKKKIMISPTYPTKRGCFPWKPYSVDKDILTILVPNEIFLGYVEKKYGYVLIYTIEELTGEHYSLDFKLKEQIKEKTGRKSVD